MCSNVLVMPSAGLCWSRPVLGVIETWAALKGAYGALCIRVLDRS